MVISAQHFNEVTNGYEKTSSGLWTHRGRARITGPLNFGPPESNAQIYDAGIDDPYTPSQRLVSINALTITPGTLHTAGLTVNGPTHFVPGSIGTADLADGAVTTAKIAANAVQATSSYFSSTTFSTTATSAWIATPITLSYTATGVLTRVEVMTTLAHSAVGGFILFGAMLDSALQVSMGAYHTPVANYQSPAFGVWYATPPAGTHTWTLAIFNAVAGTAALSTSSTHGIFVTEQRR